MTFWLPTCQKKLMLWNYGSLRVKRSQCYDTLAPYMSKEANAMTLWLWLPTCEKKPMLWHSGSLRVKRSQCFCYCNVILAPYVWKEANALQCWLPTCKNTYKTSVIAMLHWLPTYTKSQCYDIQAPYVSKEANAMTLWLPTGQKKPMPWHSGSLHVKRSQFF
jgi:hypothetical protein